MKYYLNNLLGPSIYIQILDLFLENPDSLLNLTERSRRINKNPGSVYPILPRLVEKGFLIKRKVGKVSFVYSLNEDAEIVKIFLDLFKNISLLNSH